MFILMTRLFQSHIAPNKPVQVTVESMYRGRSTYGVQVWYKYVFVWTQRHLTQTECIKNVGYLFPCFFFILEVVVLTPRPGKMCAKIGVLCLSTVCFWLLLVRT